MWDALKAWKGKVEINGKMYDSIEAATSSFKVGKDGICIKLFPVTIKAEEKAPVNIQPIPKTEPKTPMTQGEQEYKITVKKYMTEEATPTFDFMEKWNNNNPMPLRTMMGVVLQETKGMVKMRLHGVGQAEIHCMRCGRELTNPVSRHYGIGPECMQKIGFIGVAVDDVDLIKNKLQELTWEGWVIKSAITEQEVV